ncbi:MAG TPA: exonuclease domain-containing protein, partial [Pseudomonas sp.]
MTDAVLPPALQRPLALLDVQTTGLHPQRDGIWEIAVLRVDEGRVSERLSWLLDPGQPLPASVAALSGVLAAELRGQPRFAEIAGALRQALHGRLLVGHNLRFDLAFLRQGLLAAGMTLRARQLCTLRLARQLYPELPAYGLDALCEHFVIPRFLRHRAPADVEACWQLLQRLARQDAAAFERHLSGQLRKAAVPHQLSAGRLAALPERPGVYYFHGEGGALLYVGKSRNLRRRVQSHF